MVLIANPIALKDFFDQVQKFFFTKANETSLKIQNLRENEPPKFVLSIEDMALAKF